MMYARHHGKKNKKMLDLKKKQQEIILEANRDKRGAKSVREKHAIEEKARLKVDKLVKQGHAQEDAEVEKRAKAKKLIEKKVKRPEAPVMPAYAIIAMKALKPEDIKLLDVEKLEEAIGEIEESGLSDENKVKIKKALESKLKVIIPDQPSEPSEPSEPSDPLAGKEIVNTETGEVVSIEDAAEGAGVNLTEEKIGYNAKSFVALKADDLIKLIGESELSEEQRAELIKLEEAGKARKTVLEALKAE